MTLKGMKCVSKVHAQLSDSRTSYIASATIIQRVLLRVGYCSATDKNMQKALIKLIKRPLVAISGNNSHTHSSNMTALDNFFVAFST